MARKVEVFTGGCPLYEILDLRSQVLDVKIACPNCDVTIYDLKEDGLEKARGYAVTSVPTAVVNGKILDCCKRGKPTEEDLRAAGIGQPV